MIKDLNRYVDSKDSLFPSWMWPTPQSPGYNEQACIMPEIFIIKLSVYLARHLCHKVNKDVENSKGPSRAQTTDLLNRRRTLNHITKGLTQQQGCWKWPVY